MDLRGFQKSSTVSVRNHRENHRSHPRRLSRSCSGKINGKPLAYLDNAATSQKPLAVLQAMDDYYRLRNANVHRGVHTLSEEATALYEGARGRIARFINAPSSKQVIFTRNATEAVNLVAYSWGLDTLKPGDEVLITQMEHHANIVPWQLITERTGATLRYVPLDPQGTLRLDLLDELLTERTRLFAFVAMSNVLGTINPVAELVARAAQRGRAGAGGRRAERAAPAGGRAGAQLRLPGLLRPQDVRADRQRRALRPPRAAGADAALHGRRRHDPRGAAGGLALEHAALEVRGRHAGHRRSRSAWARPWTTWPAWAWTGCSSASMSWCAMPWSSLVASRGCASWGLARSSAAARWPSRWAKSTPTTSAAILDAEGIAIRAGHHCAQPIHDFYGIPASARASFYFYNTFEEIDRLVVALDKVHAVLGM